METPAPKKVGIYVRVSTKGQTVENQLLDLRQLSAARGWTVVAEFRDNGLSGAKWWKSTEHKAVLELARKRRIDLLLVWRYDRFARSLLHLVSTLEELRILGVGFVSFQESVDTSTPQGRMIFGVMASLAEFERELIRERIFCGLRRAKEQGKRLGRPELPAFKVQEVLALRGTGSYQEIADKTGVAKSQAWKILKASFSNPTQNVGSVLVGTGVGS